MPGAKLYREQMAPRWNERDTFSDSEGKKNPGGGGGSGSPTNIRRCTVGNNKAWWTVFERYRLMHVTVRGANCCTALLQPFYTSSCGLEILFGQCIPVHNILSSFISISFSVVIQSSVQYTNNNVTFVSKILNLLILGPKCLAYSFG